MATKSAKKKSSKSAAARTSRATPKKTSVKTGAVVPFNPMNTMSNFNPATPSFGGAFDSVESAMNNYKNQYEKLTGDASASFQEGIDSCIKSGNTFAKGAEKIMKALAELSQESAERNAEAVKSLMASRTLNEFAEAQNKLAQQNFDETMSAITKISEMTVKLYTEAFEPINGQVTKAMTAAMKQNAA